MLRRLAPHRLRAAYRRWLNDEFLTYYYESGRWQEVTWLNVPVKQSPADLLVLQQIVVDTRPTLIVETGTMHGGSALFFAHLLDGLDSTGRVISIDINHDPVAPQAREHPRITLIKGDSTDPATASRIVALADGHRTMLVLDADHREAAVLAELHGLADIVTPGCYAVVLDTIMGGHPAPWPYKGEIYRGPFEAVHQFLIERDDFVIDEIRERQLVTFARNGFLRRRG